jgi:hypothetical protein
MVIEWRDIPGYPGYQASSYGQIRSVDRVNHLGHRYKGRTLRELVTGGYSGVRCSIGGKQGYERVHHLVLRTFHGPRPEGRNIVARHMNGKALDNSADNLRWGTVQDNRADRTFHELHPGVRAPEVWDAETAKCLDLP